MAFNRIASAAASALPLVGIVLALANWNAKPASARAWAAGIVLFLVMLAVRHGGQLAVRRSSKNAAVNAALVRAMVGVNGSIIFAALMMIMSLSAALSHAYGFDVDPHLPHIVLNPIITTRAVMIMCGAYLIAMGNGLPRMLPPVSSMRGLGASAQAFHRFLGWTWVLCGLGWMAAWLVLPIAAAKAVSMTLAAAAMIATAVRLVRLVRKTRHHAPA